MTKNIVEAYLEQKRQFIILLSGLPTTDVNKIAKILGNDLEFNVIYMDKYLSNESLSSINDYNLDKLNTDIDKKKRNGLIISSLVFPKDISKHHIDSHINLNITKQESLDRNPNLDKNLIFFYNNQVKNSFINRFLNVSKLNEEEISNKLFNMIMEYILSRLDDGNYSDTINSDIVSSEKSDNTSDVDKEIYQSIEDSSTDVYEDLSSDISTKDLDFDDEIDPVKYIESDEDFDEPQSDNNIIGGSRKLFNKYETFKNKDIVTGYRKIQKKMKF